MENVLNGTTATIFNPAVNDLVGRYRSFAKSSASSLLGLAKTLVEAKGTLEPIDFQLFCKEVALEPNGPVYKKIMAIGAKASRFEPVLERLPSAWTTIYDLSKLPPQEFEMLEKANALSPSMTAKDLRSALGKTPASISSGNRGPDVSITFGSMSQAGEAEIVHELLRLRDKFNVKIDFKREFDTQAIPTEVRLVA